MFSLKFILILFALPRILVKVTTHFPKDDATRLPSDRPFFRSTLVGLLTKNGHRKMGAKKT